MESVIEMAEEREVPPNTSYAIRFHKEDRGRGISRLIGYGSGSFGGTENGILLVPYKDLKCLDDAGIRYESCELGMMTTEEIEERLEPNWE